jgi:hypothetical protein
MSERQSQVKFYQCDCGNGTVLQRSYQFHVDRPKEGWVGRAREAGMEINCPDCRRQGRGLPSDPIEITREQAGQMPHPPSGLV